ELASVLMSCFFFSSRRRHTRSKRDWSSDVCSSDLMLDLAFERYGAHRVAEQMDARNTASARLAERVGMHREAQLRQDWWSKGEWTDTVIFAMLASDR